MEYADARGRHSKHPVRGQGTAGWLAGGRAAPTHSRSRVPFPWLGRRASHPCRASPATREVAAPARWTLPERNGSPFHPRAGPPPHCLRRSPFRCQIPWLRRGPRAHFGFIFSLCFFVHPFCYICILLAPIEDSRLPNKHFHAHTHTPYRLIITSLPYLKPY